MNATWSMSGPVSEGNGRWVEVTVAVVMEEMVCDREPKGFC